MCYGGRCSPVAYFIEIDNGLCVESVPYDAAMKRWLAASDHYLGNPPPGCILCVVVGKSRDGLAGIRVRTEPILGMMLLGRPTARMLPQDGSMLELKRMVLIPGLPHGTASACLRAASDMAKRHGAKCLISYHDRSRHTGCIYKKAGFRKDGHTVPLDGDAKGWATRAGRVVSGREKHGHTSKRRWRLDL